MKGKNRPGNFQTLLFFVGFILLFFLVFALGVIVGKGLSDFESLLSKKEMEQLLAFRGKSISKNLDSGRTEVSKVEDDEIKETNNEIIQENKEAVTILEESTENGEEQAEMKTATEDGSVKAEIEEEKKTGLDNESVSEEKQAKKEAAPDNGSEKKEEQKKEEQVEKKAAENHKVDDTKKDDKSDYVAKLDYNIPEFPKTDPGGKYTIQIGSFQNIDTAYKLEKSLQDKGYPSFVIKAVIPEKGTWYRVRVGTFNDKEKARDYAEKIKNKEKLEFTQITLNN